MSGEHCETVLSFPLQHGDWHELLTKICRKLEARNCLLAFPKTGCWLLVDSQNGFIIKKESEIDLERLTSIIDPPEQEYWRCVYIDVRIGQGRFIIEVMFRTIINGKIMVELHFPSDVYETLYCFNSDESELDEHMKNDLVQFCVNTAKVIEAEGFGFGRTGGFRVLGMQNIESLAQYVNHDPESHPDNGENLWLLAGVTLSYLTVEEIRVRDGICREVYKRAEFTVFDLLWLSIL